MKLILKLLFIVVIYLHCSNVTSTNKISNNKIDTLESKCFGKIYLNYSTKVLVNNLNIISDIHLGIFDSITKITAQSDSGNLTVSTFYLNHHYCDSILFLYGPNMDINHKWDELYDYLIHILKYNVYNTYLSGYVLTNINRIEDNPLAGLRCSDVLSDISLSVKKHQESLNKY